MAGANFLTEVRARRGLDAEQPGYRLRRLSLAVKVAHGPRMDLRVRDSIVCRRKAAKSHLRICSPYVPICL